MILLPQKLVLAVYFSVAFVLNLNFSIFYSHRMQSKKISLPEIG